MEHDNAGTPQCLLINLCMVLVVGYLVNDRIEVIGIEPPGNLRVQTQVKTLLQFLGE